jgi:ArsR family transcriptional regulator
MKKAAAVDALAALAQESRLDVFRLLVRAGQDGQTMGDLSSRLGIPGATLNHHVGLLKTADLVRATRRGRTITVTANYAKMRQLIAYLAENCCRGLETLPCATEEPTK